VGGPRNGPSSLKGTAAGRRASVEGQPNVSEPRPLGPRGPENGHNPAHRASSPAKSGTAPLQRWLGVEPSYVPTFPQNKHRSRTAAKRPVAIKRPPESGAGAKGGWPALAGPSAKPHPQSNQTWLFSKTSAPPSGGHRAGKSLFAAVGPTVFLRRRKSPHVHVRPATPNGPFSESRRNTSRPQTPKPDVSKYKHRRAGSLLWDRRAGGGKRGGFTTIHGRKLPRRFRPTNQKRGWVQHRSRHD